MTFPDQIRCIRPATIGGLLINNMTSTLDADQETIARLAEADLITEDLERANSRVTEVERRNEKLRAEIEAVRSGSESASRWVPVPVSPARKLDLTSPCRRCRIMILETQITDLQREATRLITALDEQKVVAEQERKDLTRSIDELTKDRDARSSEVEELKLRLRQYADYDEVKRELEIMKVRILVERDALRRHWTDRLVDISP